MLCRKKPVLSRSRIRLTVERKQRPIRECLARACGRFYIYCPCTMIRRPRRMLPLVVIFLMAWLPWSRVPIVRCTIMTIWSARRIIANPSRKRIFGIGTRMVIPVQPRRVYSISLWKNTTALDRKWISYLPHVPHVRRLRKKIWVLCTGQNLWRTRSSNPTNRRCLFPSY